MINVGVIGVSGYTGLELIKILLTHPNFNLKYAVTTNGDESLDELYPALKGLINLKTKSANDIHEISKNLDLVFLALPHKTAMEFAKQFREKNIKVVDLSADYRLKKQTYELHYCSHTDENGLQEAVYGLPEINREKIKKASLIANPGCYPTASILAALPFLDFADKNIPIIIDAKSGISGAGKNPNAKTHFININENFTSYNPLSHRHAPEIKEKLDCDVVFVPHLIPINRGILASVYIRLKEEIKPLEILQKFYKNEEFVRIKENPVCIKDVAGTNFCDIYAKSDGKTLFASSAIDNLLRGASSQAVVNANLMYGFEESLGIPKIAYVP